MKISDYIVEFLIEKEIKDVFGYPGGMVTHLMDSFNKYSDKISSHLAYHEQGAAFAACGYGQVTGKPGVSFATSGPGATNLITGICNAYFDSIPTIFITGQVNTFESKGDRKVRQKGFQETDIVSMVEKVTKKSFYVDNPMKIKYYLETAYQEATTGRRGPVLLDIPMNIFRTEIDVTQIELYNEKDEYFVEKENVDEIINNIESELKVSRRPCIILGNGINEDLSRKLINDFVKKYEIPVVTSMISCDLMSNADDKISRYNYGFIGAYGSRVANFIVAKSDLVITMGTRLDVRQVGGKRENFAINSKIIRIDIDEYELNNVIRDDEINYRIEANIVLEGLNKCDETRKYDEWIEVCDEIKVRLSDRDNDVPNNMIKKISMCVPEDRVITTDVGQNQVWVAQSFIKKKNQRLLFSGGHGAMGYSLPAAIGAYYGCKKPVISFNGDGGLQMNIQELQFIARERLPIKIIVLNNKSLGMIRHFQEMYFESRFTQTVSDNGYTVPDFCKIAQAYGIKSRKIGDVSEIENIEFDEVEPELIEIEMDFDTYVFPKLEFGKPNQDQEPLIDRQEYNYLMQL